MKIFTLLCMLALILGCDAGDNSKSKIWWWNKSKRKDKGKGDEAIVHHYHHYVKGAHRPEGKRYVIVIPFKMKSPGYDQPYDWDSGSYHQKQHGVHKSKGFFKHRSSQSEESENLPLSTRPHHPGVSTDSSDRFQLQLQKQLAKLTAPNHSQLRRNGEDTLNDGVDLINITPMIRQSAAKQLTSVQHGQRRRGSRFR